MHDFDIYYSFDPVHTLSGLVFQSQLENIDLKDKVFEVIIQSLPA